MNPKLADQTNHSPASLPTNCGGSRARLTRRGALLLGLPSLATRLFAQPALQQPRGQSDHSRGLALAHGDRYTKSGRERLVIAGSATTPRGLVSVRLTYELPGKMRYEETNGRGNNLVINGGSGLALSRSAADDDDDDLLESLFYDSPDYFFSTARDGATSLRYLGSRFRTSSGALVDIYQSVLVAAARRDAPNRAKYYAFDSSNGLLVTVRSSSARGNVKTQVDTEWTEWRVVDGQRVPGRMRRLENGLPRLNVTMGAAVFSPALPDSSFTRA